MSLIQVSILSAVVTAFLGMGMTIWYQCNAADELRKALRECGQKTAQQVVSLEQWKQASEQQNMMIDNLKKTAKDREEKAAKASAEAKKLRDQMAINASNILSQRVDADDCLGAKQVLSTYMRGR